MNRGNTYGKGSISFDNTKNRWVGQISLGKDENGKTKRKTVYGNTKNEVRQKLKQVEVGIYTGTFIDNSTITIYQLAKQMLDDKLNLNYIKESTYWRDIATLGQLKDIYNTPLQAVTETQIKDFLLKNQNYSQSTINKIFEMLLKTMKEALKRKIISSNPLEDMKRPRSRKAKEKTRALTVGEQQKLFKLLVTEDIPYSEQMLLSMLTGMRIGEINALTVSDINLNFNTIFVHRTISRVEKGAAILNNETKTSAGVRTLSILNPDVKRILTECVNNCNGEMLFMKNGKLITASQVNSEFTRILKKYDIQDKSVDGKITMHSLRHTFATRCIESDMPPKVLQTILGHTDIRITMNTYCDAFDKYQKKSIDKATDYFKQLGITLDNEESQIMAIS